MTLRGAAPAFNAHAHQTLTVHINSGSCLWKPTIANNALRARSLLSQELGAVTLRVLSRPGRITQAGHIMTIVRNVAGTGAADEVGRIRLLQDKKTGQEVRSKGSLR